MQSKMRGPASVSVFNLGSLWSRMRLFPTYLSILNGEVRQKPPKSEILSASLLPPVLPHWSCPIRSAAKEEGGKGQHSNNSSRLGDCTTLTGS
jgi:hypothetical protein